MDITIWYITFFTSLNARYSTKKCVYLSANSNFTTFAAR